MIGARDRLRLGMFDVDFDVIRGRLRVVRVILFVIRMGEKVILGAE